MDTTQDPKADLDLQNVRKTMTELRLECTYLEAHALEVLNQLLNVRARLARSDNGVRLECDRLAAIEKDLAERRQAADASEDHGNEINNALLKAKEAEEALEFAQQKAREQERFNDQLRERVEEMQREAEAAERERDQLRADLDASVREAAQAAELRTELEISRRELEQIHAQLETARREASRLQEQRGETRVEPSRCEPGALSEFEEERTALETELEQTRRRAAELAGTLVEERNRFAIERRAWSDEMSQLRNSMQRSATPYTAPRQVRAAAIGVDQRASTTVVDSVLAQFAQVRKDAECRRSKMNCAVAS